MRVIIAALTAAVLSMPVAAKEKPVWTATRTVDPITGKTSCVIAAYDGGKGLWFTRIGALYPIVEMNSEYGLLVGVSSGGTVRMPTGDIVWRVDDLPYREIRAGANPGVSMVSTPAANTVTQVTQESLAMARALTATSTVASGDTAWAMLAEMRRGSGLQFRQAAVATGYGLPQQQAMATGQITKKGLRPFPLDGSFHAALQSCGLGEGPDPREPKQ